MAMVTLGLETDKYHARAKRYLRRGFGGVLSFGVKGGTAGSKAFVDALRLVSIMTKWVFVSFVPLWRFCSCHELT